MGPGAGQLGGDAAAKNCITVGAIGTPRPNNGFEATTDGHVITGIEQIADFSSRGPTLPTDSEGNEAGSRIKPDLVAPGVAILSTASQTLPDNDPERTTYGKPPSHEWIYMTGTSMATPLAAGCVAVLRQAFKRENNNAEPSAALVKAFLMNRAVPLKGSQLPFRPDGQQRHGRVDLESSVRMTASSASAGFRDAGKSDALGVDGEWTSTTVTVPAGATLNATLAYPDPPGGKLQNDLNLIVEAGDGSKRYGNMGDDAGLDNVNNVEKVTWQGVPGGSARISVKVAGLTEVEKDGSDPTQEYAVVWEAK